jgi:hypothetical protein
MSSVEPIKSTQLEVAASVKSVSGGAFYNAQEIAMANTKRPTKDQRLQRLLEVGFFPNDLPPPFISSDFARYRKYLKRTWPTQQLKQFASGPEFYSVPRFGRARRRFSIINPINHFKVSSLMSYARKLVTA